MDNENLRRLLDCARLFSDELSRHIVLQKYWDRLSLILKGSTARGYSDKYSDIDLVFFSDEVTKRSIIADYILNGLSERKDGIFLHPHNLEGHYNLDTYENLEAYFTSRNMVAVWEYTNILIMHDNGNRYNEVVAQNTKALFDNTDDLIKDKYFEIQLYLDWMRQPLRRADICASIQYAVHVQRYCCHIMFLLSGQAYPPDKWLFYYLKTTGISNDLHSKIVDYSKTICEAVSIKPDMELAEYGIFEQAAVIITNIKDILRNRYGPAKWIDEWYLYV